MASDHAAALAENHTEAVTKPAKSDSTCMGTQRVLVLPNIRHIPKGLRLAHKPWCIGRYKLAAVTTEGIVVLFEDTGEQRDRFKTKPADAALQQAYVVRGLAFSPDSTKLAVAQVVVASSTCHDLVRTFNCSAGSVEHACMCIADRWHGLCVPPGPGVGAEEKHL